MIGQSGMVTVTAHGRDLLAGTAGPARVELAAEDFTLHLAGSPLVAAYRDLTTLAVQRGQLLLVLGGGEARVLLEGMGDRLGLLLGELRERRARQLLADRLIELADDEAIELAEYRAGDEHGVAQLAFHAWGAALLPLDERQPQRIIRRADIAAVEALPAAGTLRIAVGDRPGLAGSSFELLGLGAGVERQRARWAALRESAQVDAASIVGQLMPDAPLGQRRLAASLLVDGHPIGRSQLGEAWAPLEAAVLSEPVFAATYGALTERARGPSWIALAPARPGERDHVAWFFVALPANLLAMEIVSEGAHATYLFRIVARADYGGQPPAQLAGPAAQAVAEVSDALIDMRFLREPIYVPAERLREPGRLRARLAISALPSVQAARQRFVGRLIHRDEASWARSLDDALSWHATARDDSAVWPGSASDEEPTDEHQPVDQPSTEEGT